MIYQELAPPEDLRDVLACFWRFCLEPHDPSRLMHTIPPDGTVSLAWTPEKDFVFLVGPRTDALRIEVTRGTHYFGIRVRPGAAGPLLGIDVPSLRNGRVLLEQVSPPDRASSLLAGLRTVHESLQEDLAEASLAIAAVIRRWKYGPPDKVVQELIERIVQNADAEIRDLVAGLDVGYRQVLRRFVTAVGLTPKEFARLRRVRSVCIRALASRDDPAWAEISAEGGFADQPHLAREVKWAFGWPPTLVLEYLRQIEHRDVRADH